MTDIHGFMKYPRRPVPARPVQERLGDWNEVYAGQALLPVVSVAAAAAYYLKSFPTQGHDVRLEVIGVVAGAAV